MRKCQTRSTTELTSDGDGPSVAVVVNQTDAGSAGWIISLYARFADPATALVRRVTLTNVAATNGATRVVMVATIPGARGYMALVQPPVPAPDDPIEVGLLTDVTPALPPTNVLP